MRSLSLFSTRTFYEKKKKKKWESLVLHVLKGQSELPRGRFRCQIEVQNFFSRAASEGSESPII